MLPDEFLPADIPLVSAFSCRVFVFGGMLYNTQCTHVPAGASGSSTMRAKDWVPAGEPLHVSAGELFLPVQVYFAGMDCPLANASLLISIDIAASVASFVDSPVGVSVDEQAE